MKFAPKLISVFRHFRKAPGRQRVARKAKMGSEETRMPLPIEHSVASAFENVAGVESVYVRQSGPILNVFPVINEEDERTLDRIFDCEISLRRLLRDVNFDFEIIVRHGRDVREFVGKNSPIWQRKAEEISASER